MKLPDEVSSVNALIPILEIFKTKEPKPLVLDQMNKVQAALNISNIQCENFSEVLKCIEVLGDMKVLEIVKTPRPKGHAFLVGNLINGE